MGQGFSPIHSHEDRETFFVLSGEIEAWVEDKWSVFREGDTLDIPSNQKHAWRNTSSEHVSLLVASTVKMGKFFKEVGRPADSVLPGSPDPAAVQLLVEVSLSYGYWLGSPDDNAAIGLSLG